MAKTCLSGLPQLHIIYIYIYRQSLRSALGRSDSSCRRDSNYSIGKALDEDYLFGNFE